MFDWDGAETKLHEATLAAIECFAHEHAEELVCFFAFDSDPKYGYVLFAFDTFENNVRSAWHLEQYTTESRNEWLTKRRNWNSAEHHLCHPPVSVFNTNSGDFAFPQYAEVKFPEWEVLTKSSDYPKREKHDDDYLDSNVRILFWNVAQRLVNQRAFEVLSMASPFMIGYGIHDGEEQILRVLNWPVAVQSNPSGSGT